MIGGLLYWLGAGIYTGSGLDGCWYCCGLGGG